ncbi:MAG: hypothetical protein K2X81_24155 [Candidatus Obscuribacterales bacterium]|nr:hypothetical protein [Candidatus Obscuribacterales bacterium]
MLVKPLKPSSIEKLINAGLSKSGCLEHVTDELAPGKLLELVNAAVSEGNRPDGRKESRHCVQNMEQRLFAAYVCHALWCIKVNDSQEAKTAIDKASRLAGVKESAIDKTVVLETLGLLRSLVDQLDDLLSRYRPCL